MANISILNNIELDRMEKEIVIRSLFNDFDENLLRMSDENETKARQRQRETAYIKFKIIEKFIHSSHRLTALYQEEYQIAKSALGV